MTLAAPIAVPPRKRKALNATISQARPVPIELTKKIAAAIFMTTMRPWRSASGPANQAPIAEPRSAPATAKPSSQEAAPDQALMASTAPLMTAVSNPNRNPPIAADAATSATLRTAAPSGDDPRAAGRLLSMIDITFDPSRKNASRHPDDRGHMRPPCPQKQKRRPRGRLFDCSQLTSIAIAGIDRHVAAVRLRP